MRAKLLKEESGFTLVEVMVTMMLMILVMFALYSIFDMSIRVFSFGNDKIEAVENARIGVSKMEREIRAAYPLDRTVTPPKLFDTSTGANQITFGLDLNGNRVVDAGERVTYTKSGNTLTRTEGSGLPQPAIEYVSGLEFGYQNRFGASVPYSSAEIVNIKLTVDKDGRTQELQTDVSLRNKNT